MENKDNETFRYTYSASQQEEIKAIRKKYAPADPQEDKMEQLRRLDTGVTHKAMTVSLVLGIVGALVLGFGMSLAMTDFSRILGALSEAAMLIGSAVGIVGIILMCLAYPVYNYILKKQRKKIGPEIFRLTDELMK